MDTHTTLVSFGGIAGDGTYRKGRCLRRSSSAAKAKNGRSISSAKEPVTMRYGPGKVLRSLLRIQQRNAVARVGVGC